MANSSSTKPSAPRSRLWLYVVVPAVFVLTIFIAFLFFEGDNVDFPFFYQ